MSTIFRLIHLEWKQCSRKLHLWITVGIACIGFLAAWGMSHGRQIEDVSWLSWPVDLCFMVYSNVLFAVCVMDRCQGAAAERLFSYPFRLRSLVSAQVGAVWIRMAVTWILSRVWIVGSVALICWSEKIDIEWGGYGFLTLLLDVVSVLNGCFVPLIIGVCLRTAKVGAACSVLSAVLVRQIAVSGGVASHVCCCLLLTGIVAALVFLMLRVLEKREI